MAGQVVQGKGADPATPSNGYASTWPDITTGQMKSKTDAGVLSILSPNARINFLRNSGFWFAQRQAPLVATTYSAAATRSISADGWGIMTENASGTYQQTDTSGAPEAGLNGRYYGTFLKITSTGKASISQVLEGTDANAIRNRTVRFQLWMKGTASQTVRLGLIQLTSAGTIDTMPGTYITGMNGTGVDPTLGTNLSYITPKSGVTPDNCAVNGNAVDCTVTTAWQRFGAVFDVPSNCKNILVSVWSNAQLTATNGFSLAQASLTDGFEIQDWSPLNGADERLRVQRFFQRSFALDTTAPAQNAGVGTGEAHGIAGKATAVANSGIIPVRFGPIMRSSGVLTLFNPAAANALMRNVTGTADMGATATAQSTNAGFNVIATGVAATAVGDQVAIHWTADAEI